MNPFYAHLKTLTAADAAALENKYAGSAYPTERKESDFVDWSDEAYGLQFCGKIYCFIPKSQVLKIEHKGKVVFYLPLWLEEKAKEAFSNENFGG